MVIEWKGGDFKMDIVPHCGICDEPIKLSQRAVLNVMNGLNHEKCADGREFKDKGTVEELLDRHPEYLGDLKKYITK